MVEEGENCFLCGDDRGLQCGALGIVLHVGQHPAHRKTIEGFVEVVGDLLRVHVHLSLFDGQRLIQEKWIVNPDSQNNLDARQV